MTDKYDELSEMYEQSQRELIGVQEMLAHVLAVVGEPVVVAKESLRDGLQGVGINIDDHADSFVFSLSSND